MPVNGAYAILRAMREASIRLATLNLHHFHEWEARFPLIVQALRAADPDLVFFQQAERDPIRGSKANAELLNEQLGYPHQGFYPIGMKTTRKGKPLPAPVEHGMAVLSRIPYAARAVPLGSPAGMETRINVECRLDVGGAERAFVNAHFWNSDELAEANLRETLDLYRDAEPKPVIAGDLNIKDLSALRDAYSKEYVASCDRYGYISHPDDGVSYDHILIPLGADFGSFECVDAPLSDHRMLVVDLFFGAR